MWFYPRQGKLGVLWFFSFPCQKRNTIKKKKFNQNFKKKKRKTRILIVKDNWARTQKVTEQKASKLLSLNSVPRTDPFKNTWWSCSHSSHRRPWGNRVNWLLPHTSFLGSNSFPPFCASPWTSFCNYPKRILWITSLNSPSHNSL